MKVWIHIKGNVAEYTATERGTSGQYYDLTARLSGDDVWFSGREYREDSVKFPNWYDSKEEALQAAMDYHETEGCKLYLELYPAPEKKWNWVAQDSNGRWFGYDEKPVAGATSWETNRLSRTYTFISQSPPNPFWRKTLQ